MINQAWEDEEPRVDGVEFVQPAEILDNSSATKVTTESPDAQVQGDKTHEPEDFVVCSAPPPESQHPKEFVLDEPLVGIGFDASHRPPPDSTTSESESEFGSPSEQ